MTVTRERVRRGGAKGLPRAHQALYDAIDAEGGFNDHIQASVSYGNTLFVLGTKQFLSIAPWDGEIVAVAMVNQADITSGPSLVDFDIEGGDSNPVAQLTTGDNAAGTADFELLDPPVPILQGEVVSAQSDGVATGSNAEVVVFVILRST